MNCKKELKWKMRMELFPFLESSEKIFKQGMHLSATSKESQ